MKTDVKITFFPKTGKKPHKDLGLWSILLHSPKSWAGIELKPDMLFCDIISFYKAHHSFYKLLWI